MNIRSHASSGFNLARKWRSHQFDTLVGQELIVRILKNSLYLSSLFPVYLFSGTRGCGKTSTARIFAAAINCQELAAFQQDPKGRQLPCLTCNSCDLMMKGQHPDFIEIDAASHTGVDNVRDIIDAASLLPVVGKKKIYLIDEAHMLSKAAFNAFLKILEEPPASVHFILATTEAHKILETVRSRCFQLFFEPLSAELLAKHLKFICDSESISYDNDALLLIAHEAAGSARDALNMVERLRFSAEKIDIGVVSKVLHHADSSSLIELFELIIAGDQAPLVAALERIPHQTIGSQVFWKQSVELIQSLIWLSNGCVRLIYPAHEERLLALARSTSSGRFVVMLEQLYETEYLFHKTAVPHIFMQLIFLKLAVAVSSNVGSGTGADGKSRLDGYSGQVRAPVSLPAGKEKKDNNVGAVEQPSRVIDDKWSQFLIVLEKELEDPMVISIFKQARFISFDGAIVEIAFGKNLSFFSEVLTTHQKAWDPILKSSYGQNVSCLPRFIDEGASPKMTVPLQRSARPQDPVSSSGASKIEVSSSVGIKNGKQARLLLQYFPGTLSLVGSDYE